MVQSDNVEVFEYLLDDVYMLSTDAFQDVWHVIIENNSFNIMAFLCHEKVTWCDDMLYATTIGNLECLCFLITELGRHPNNGIVLAAVMEGHLNILQFLRFYSKTNKHFRRFMWSDKIVETAIEYGQLDCLKFILNEDYVWTTDVISQVCQVVGRFDALHPKVLSGIMECIRFIFDSNHIWSIPLCPILFDGCSVLNCKSCITKETSFIAYRHVLRLQFKERFDDIIRLMLSYACTFKTCANCLFTKETYESEEHFVRCHRCNSTYYCNEQCRSVHWRISHEIVCR